jgi:thiol-disulfide isomerase/thioredoxin
MPNRKTQNIKFIILLLILSSTFSFAQNEIPDNIKNQIIKGIAALESAKVPEDIESAFTLFKQAAELEPSYPDVHYFLGKTLSLMQGNTGKALSELKKYLELYPEAPDKEKVNAEIEQLDESIELNKNSYLMGISLMELSDGIYVRKVSPNYPSYGRRSVPIRVGDKIIQINDIDVTGFSLQSVMKVFNEDTTSMDKPRKITIVRGGNNQELLMYKRSKEFNPTIKDLGEDDLAKIISETKKPLVVFFVSDWCDSCQYYLMDRSISRPTYKYSKEIAFIYANIDERSSIAQEFNIIKTPTIYLYKNGKLFDKIIGYDIELFEERAEELLR